MTQDLTSSTIPSSQSKIKNSTSMQIFTNSSMLLKPGKIHLMSEVFHENLPQPCAPPSYDQKAHLERASISHTSGKKMFFIGTKYNCKEQVINFICILLQLQRQSLSS